MTFDFPAHTLSDIERTRARTLEHAHTSGRCLMCVFVVQGTPAERVCNKCDMPKPSDGANACALTVCPHVSDSVCEFFSPLMFSCLSLYVPASEHVYQENAVRVRLRVRVRACACFLLSLLSLHAHTPFIVQRITAACVSGVSYKWTTTVYGYTNVRFESLSDCLFRALSKR